jgi:hypothetical protein
MLAEPVTACPPWGCRSLEEAPTSGPWHGPQGLAGASMLAGATWRAGAAGKGARGGRFSGHMWMDLVHGF